MLIVYLFVIFLGVVVILLFNVMEVLSVGGGALLDRPRMVFQRVCVCVVPLIPVSINMLIRYVLFVFVYVGHYLRV